MPPACRQSGSPPCQQAVMPSCCQAITPSGRPSGLPVCPTDCSAPKHRLGEMSDANLYCSRHLALTDGQASSGIGLDCCMTASCAISEHRSTAFGPSRHHEGRGGRRGRATKNGALLGSLIQGRRGTPPDNGLVGWRRNSPERGRVNRSRTERSPVRSAPGSGGRRRCLGSGIGPAEREPHHRFQQ